MNMFLFMMKSFMSSLVIRGLNRLQSTRLVGREVNRQSLILYTTP